MLFKTEIVKCLQIFIKSLDVLFPIEISFCKFEIVVLSLKKDKKQTFLIEYYLGFPHFKKPRLIVADQNWYFFILPLSRIPQRNH